MRGYKVLLISSFIIAIILGCFSNQDVILIDVFDQNRFLPDKDISLLACFMKIFMTNLIVGFVILFFMSFITGGLLAIFVMFINGFILGRLFLELILFESLNLQVKVLSILHIPIELYAFLLFSFCSHNGFYLILEGLKNDKINYKYFPKKRELFQPVLLLFIAAMIESLIIYYIIL